jgi:hypothetical protein
MDPRLDVRGRIAELIASAQPAQPPTTATEPPRPSRVRTALGGALISAGRALAGDQGSRAQSAARR